jgi:hypothetical protein
MSKNDKPSPLDYTNSITSAYNHDARALNVVNVNNLVPVRFGKVEVQYITSGNGAGQVGRADYYSTGVYQETSIICRGDSLGFAHKTTINFIGRTPASLAGKAIVLHDDGGAVNVWFNVDFANSQPTVPGTYRAIAINLLSSQDSETIAKKVVQALAMDPSFLGVYSLTYVIISSSSSGIKPDSYDFNTQLFLKNTSGSPPQTLNNRYFFINSAENANQYYVWYNVNGTGTNPSVSGKTGIMVAISSGYSANQVAAATKAALDTTNKFITNINGDTLEVSNQLVGPSDPAKENDTGFVIFVQKSGEARQLLASVVIAYDADCNIVSAERL